MLIYQLRPIDQWPGARTKFSISSKFSAPWSNTLDLLERELKYIAARNIVIQLDVDLHELRNDGTLRAGARPKSSGIILSFDSKHGPLSYPADRFNDWQDNVRAVALSLNALRTVDRYGVTRQAEQYRGWARLPSPSGSHAMTRDEALRFIRTFAPHESDTEKALRAAEMASHPDRGGDAEKFKLVQEARVVLQGR